jgi:hypothetical protein
VLHVVFEESWLFFINRILSAQPDRRHGVLPGLKAGRGAAGMNPNATGISPAKQRRSGTISPPEASPITEIIGLQ